MGNEIFEIKNTISMVKMMIFRSEKIDILSNFHFFIKSTSEKINWLNLFIMKKYF